MPQICLSAGNTTLDNIFSYIDYAENRSIGLLEIRFDLLSEIENSPEQPAAPDMPLIHKIAGLLSYAKNKGINLIGTKRKSEKDVPESNISRIKFLKLLVELGFPIIDIELDAIERHLIKDFIDFAHSKKSKVILSVHNFNKKLDEQTIIQYYIDSCYFLADYFKLADTANSNEDAMSALEINLKLARIKMSDSSSFPEFSVFSMGDKGKITRVLSLAYGSSFSYCSSPSGATAPGQMGADELKNGYSIISKTFKF